MLLLQFSPLKWMTTPAFWLFCQKSFSFISINITVPSALRIWPQISTSTIMSQFYASLLSHLDWFNNLNVSLLLFLFLIIYFQNRSIIPMSVKIKTSPLQQPTNCCRSFSVSSVLWSHFFLPFLLFTLIQQHCLCCSSNILDPLLPREFG